jgi:hypothetical protein
MNETWWRRDAWKWVVLACAAAVLLYMLIRLAVVSPLNTAPTFGQGLARETQQGGVRRTHKFVADMMTGEYWPNEPRYSDAIAPENRVYLRDMAAVEEFGYRPGRR